MLNMVHIYCMPSPDCLSSLSVLQKVNMGTSCSVFEESSRQMPSPAQHAHGNPVIVTGWSVEAKSNTLTCESSLLHLRFFLFFESGAKGDRSGSYYYGDDPTTA